MFKWIERIIIKKVIKKALDALPANGKKTFIGIAIIALGALGAYFGGDSSIGSLIQFAIDYLRQLEHVPAEQLGLVTLIIGIIHKILKRDDEKSPEERKQELKDKINAINKEIDRRS